MLSGTVWLFCRSLGDIMILRYAIFVIFMLSSLTLAAPTPKSLIERDAVQASSNRALSQDLLTALEMRDALLRYVNNSLEARGQGILQCASVEYYVKSDTVSAWAQFEAITKTRKWGVLDSAEITQGAIFILDTDPNNRRAYALAGIIDSGSGANLVWFSRCLQRA